MRGKVLSYDDYTGSGLISGDDGVRYTFTRGGLMGGAREAFAGQQVDFEIADGVASNIYITSGAPLNLSGDKNKIVAALLAFFLGWITFGIIPFIVGVIAFIEFIIYLVKPDAEFHRDYVAGNKSWF
jgi:cold shock CspA family protein